MIQTIPTYICSLTIRNHPRYATCAVKNSLPGWEARKTQADNRPFGGIFMSTFWHAPSGRAGQGAERLAGACAPVLPTCPTRPFCIGQVEHKTHSFAKDRHQ